MKNIIVILSLLIPGLSYAQEYHDTYQLSICGEYLREAKAHGLNLKGPYFKDCQQVVSEHQSKVAFTEMVKAKLLKDGTSVYVIETKYEELKVRGKDFDLRELSCEPEKNKNNGRCTGKLTGLCGKVSFSVLDIVVVAQKAYMNLNYFNHYGNCED